MNTENLPSEVIAEILSHDPNLILSGRQLSRQIYQRLDPIYLKQFCLAKINQKELDTYLFTRPKIFALFTHQIISEDDRPLVPTCELYFYFLSSYLSLNISCHYFEDFDETYYSLAFRNDIGNTNPTNIKLQTDKHLTNNYPNVLDPVNEVDLLSMYKILRTRLTCLRINPDYAKNTVINRFNQIVTGYMNHPSRTRILDLYMYLIVHMWIFNINGVVLNNLALEIDFTIDTKNNGFIDQPINNPRNQRILNEHRQQIDELIILIRQELNKLN